MNKSILSRLSEAAPNEINVSNAERIASMTGGAVLMYYGLRKFSLSHVALAASGGAMLYRGMTGYCPGNQKLGRNTASAGQENPPIEIDTSLTVEQSRDEVYAFWRQLENLPRFMEHLSEVRQYDDGRSHWVAVLPSGFGQIEWDAEIQAEEEGRRIVWHSVKGADIENSGEVRFKDAPGGRGTEIHTKIAYRPPAGKLGQAAAQLFNPAFEQLVKEDIRRFKQVAEGGEIPSVNGKPPEEEATATE